MLSISKVRHSSLKNNPFVFLSSSCNLVAAGNLGKDEINLCASRVQKSGKEMNSDQGTVQYRGLLVAERLLF